MFAGQICSLREAFTTKPLVVSLPPCLPAHQDSPGPSKHIQMGLKVPVDTPEGADPEHTYLGRPSRAGY